MDRRRLVRAWIVAAIAGAAALPACPSAAGAQPASADDAARTAAEEAKRAYSLYEQMNAEYDKGRYAAAAAIAEQLSARFTADSQGAVPLDVAFAFASHGDYLRAEPILLRELTWYTGPGEFLVLTLRGLAEIYLALGEYGRAEQTLTRAVDMVTQVAAVGDWHHIWIREALGRLYLERGEYQRAKENIDKLHELCDGANSIVVAIPDLLLGEVHLRRGYIEEAEPLLRKAREGIERYNGVEHPRLARVLDDLGVLLTRKGEPAEAEKLLLQALVLRERQQSPNHPDIVRSLEHLANLDLSRGNPAGAVRARERAAEIQDRSARVLLARGSERQKRALMALLQRDTDASVSLHLQSTSGDQGAARLALRSILRRKGLALDAVAAGFLALRRSGDAEAQALFERIARLDARLSTAISRGPIDMPAEEHRREVAALEAERQKLEAALAVRTQAQPGGPALGEPVALEAVQAAIPEGAALVEIVQYRPYDPFGPPVRPTWGKPRYAAYVLGRRGDVAAIDLGGATAIHKAVADLVPKLSDPTRDPRPSARRLDALVMQPIRALLQRAVARPEGAGGARWILLSPDGALNLVPFAALVDEQDRDLITRASFTYLTSGRDLLHPGARTDEPATEPLVMADPAFGSASTIPQEGTQRGLRSTDMAAFKFTSLPGTRVEAEAVQRALGRATLLTGAAATEEALKAAHRPRLLHVATHGFFLADQAVGADPGPARGSLPTGGAEASRGGEDPLLRSGLALAGANARRSTSDQDDGVLTALEISGLDLRGTRLVVLSACETGLGEVLPGDGVYGLRRALVIAGAETQVMSLWKIEDGATRDLMTAYYTGLSRGGGRTEALRAAQLEMRSQRPHPYAWAGFIVSGDGASLDGKQIAPALARVDPGPRGCACAAGRGGDQGAAPLAAFGAALLLAARRRTKDKLGC